MKTERIVLSSIAILIGLFVAGIVFYFLQVAGAKPDGQKHVISILPTPSPENTTSLLSITEPLDETLSLTKSVTLKGKSSVGATIVITSENGQQVVVADDNGSFSEKIILDEGVNLFQITSIEKGGKSESITYTLSYSTESF